MFTSNAPLPQPAPAAIPPDQTRGLITAASYFALVGLMALLLRQWQWDQVPGDAAGLAMALLAVCGMPLAIWRYRGSSGAPMFELICMAFAMAYAVPIFLVENSIYSYNTFRYLDWGYTVAGQQLALLGVSSMIGGYYLFPQLPLSRMLPQLDLPLPPQHMRRYLWLAFGAAGALRVAERLLGASWTKGGFAAIAALFSHLLTVGVALLAYRIYRVQGASRVSDRLLLGVVVVVMVVMNLGGGMLESVFLPLLVIFVVRWHATRRFPVAWCILGLASVFFLNSAKLDYRAEVWDSSRSYTLAEQVQVWADKGQNVLLALSSADTTRVLFNRTIARFDLVHILAHVMESTPSYLPHYEGQTYEYLLYGWVPRALWPNKPLAQAANVLFAVDYGLLLDSQTDTTMVGVGFLAEAYANFGRLGVVVVMLLFGSYFGLTNCLFNGPASDGGRAVFIAVLAFYLNGIGSATSMFIFFGIQGFVGLSLILWFFARRWRALPDAPAIAPAPPAGHAASAAPR